MLSKYILVVATLAASTFAAPFKPTTARSLHKRANPTIGPGFTPQETTQLNDAFRDAMQLASYVVSTPASSVDPILEKYFDKADRKAVMDVFNKILDNNPQSKDGHPLLGDISIVVDYKDARGILACDGYTMAALRDWSTDNPKLIVCAGAGFGHGGIAKGYSGVEEVECGKLDSRVSWKMETLGSILLHEYTHFLKLISPPLGKETDDDAYAPSRVRDLDKTKATNNADSYSWFATENLWTLLCHTQYQDPTRSDDDDPNCNGGVCQAPKGPGP